MPRLTIAALINADTGLGASGWARGSQACSGSSPAFEPNPARVSANTMSRTPLGSVQVPVSRSEPAAADATMSPTRTSKKPSWVITA